MTLEQKASFCSGRDKWKLKDIAELGIPVIRVSDGPHGLRMQDSGEDHVELEQSIPATCFPPAVSLAATWNCELLEETGACPR